jgi:hypothetical protein
MTATRKPRPRRIAADEAHAWARNLRLHNSLAKLVLSMTTLYVNGDGACFVAVPSLAEDTELAANTVRSRLAYLEEIGAIARFPQWVDEAGRRNAEGRGRRTSDEIRLMLDADPDEIEARALGRKVADGQAVDPSHGEGSDEPEPAFDPPHAEGATDPKNLPLDSADPSATLQLRGRPESLEPEPEEDSPLPPKGGTGNEADENRENETREPEGWPGFKSIFESDGLPIMRVSIARTLFAAVPPDQRPTLMAAAKGLIAQREKLKKPGAKPSAQTFIRETGAWEAFARLAPDDPQPAPDIRFIAGESDEFRALQIADLIARAEMREPKFCDGHGEGYLTRRLPPRADFLALADEKSFDLSRWQELDVKSDGEAIGAWRRRFKEWGLGELEAERVSTDEVFAHSPSGMPLYRKRERLIVPRYWPPRVNGTWPEADEPFAKTG